MSRCYHCGSVLSDDWLRKQGASAMGKKGGKNKARGSEVAKRAANTRWDRAREAWEQKRKKETA